MDNERIAREVMGYVYGIFVMGAVSKGIQFVERRQRREKEKEKEEAQGKWKVSEKVVREKDGTVKRKMVISRIATVEEIDHWDYCSDRYYAAKEGKIIVRVTNKEKPKKESKGEAMVRKGKTMTKRAGKVMAGVFLEGTKTRVGYELKDISRGYAKSSKETEVFLKNNVKNKLRLRRQNNMF